jgi:hypothetical protein
LEKSYHRSADHHGGGIGSTSGAAFFWFVALFPAIKTTLKALVNMVMNINTAGLAEGLGWAEALGLDLKLVSFSTKR